MSDNIQISQGSGTAVSTEYVTNLNGAGAPGQHVQRIFPAVRTSDATVQDVTTLAPLPVILPGTSQVIVNDATPVRTRAAVSNELRPTITGSTSAYAPGDLVGGQITIVNAVQFTSWGLLIEQVSVFSDDGHQPNLNVMFFNQQLVGGTYTDNAAPTLSAADKSGWSMTVPVATANWTSAIGGDTFATVPVHYRMKPNGTSDIRLLIVTQSAFTMAAATNFRMILGVRQD